MDDDLICEPAPASARVARRYVVDHLQEWGLDHLVDQAALMTSELATIALNTTDQPFRVRVLQRQGAVRVEVADAGPTLPELRAASPAADDEVIGDLFSGLGMVDAIATAWGSEPRPEDDGKVVWFELSTAAPSLDAIVGESPEARRAAFDDALDEVYALQSLSAAADDQTGFSPPVWLLAATALAIVAVLGLGLWAGGVLGAVWYGH